ncbi:MAG: DUF502 domain-containing protein [Phycisphaerales bacterium]|nr:DUF502 domain-containing protein [Phycisphaerales bacterium]
MTEAPPRTFRTDFKRFFLRGLAVLLPSVLTLWILVKAYQFIDIAIAEPINAGIRVGLVETSLQWPAMQEFFVPEDATVSEEITRRLEASEPRTDPNQVRRDVVTAQVKAWWTEWSLYLNWIGILVAIVSVYIAGRLLGGFLGRRIHRRLERIITAVPLFKQVYPYVKQIVDFLFSDDKPIKFNRVVVVEYPRKGIWSVGLVTGGTMRSIETESGDAITVFIPSSPTPFTGYTITVPREELHELPISIDEALRFTISGGVLIPPHETIEGADDAATSSQRILNPPAPLSEDDSVDPTPPESEAPGPDEGQSES